MCIVVGAGWDGVRWVGSELGVGSDGGVKGGCSFGARFRMTELGLGLFLRCGRIKEL